MWGVWNHTRRTWVAFNVPRQADAMQVLGEAADGDRFALTRGESSDPDGMTVWNITPAIDDDEAWNRCAANILRAIRDQERAATVTPSAVAAPRARRVRKAHREFLALGQ